MKRVAGYIWLVIAIALLCCCAENPSDAGPPGRLEGRNSAISADESITDDRRQDEENPADRDDTDSKKGPSKDEGSIGDYKITPGNILNVEGGIHTVIDKTVKVDDKGYIKLIYIDRVKVSGLTKWEAEDLLTKKFEKFFKDAQITLEIINLKYFIGGEVKLPGQKALQDDVTLTQAIQVAGGVTPWANMKKVTVKRVGKDGKSIVKTYNCDKINAGEAKDPYLRPNDQVNVPR